MGHNRSPRQSTAASDLFGPRPRISVTHVEGRTGVALVVPVGKVAEINVLAEGRVVTHSTWQGPAEIAVGLTPTDAYLLAEALKAQALQIDPDLGQDAAMSGGAIMDDRESAGAYAARTGRHLDALPGPENRRPARRCDAHARKGTGTGVCDRPLDEYGHCDRTGDHLEDGA